VSDPFDRYAGDYEGAVERSIAFAHVGHEMFIKAKARVLLHTVDRHLGTPGGKSFLDVGCGVGAMQRYVAPVAGFSAGVDTSADSIEAAKMASPGSELAGYEGSVLPYPDDRFDVTFAVNVVHHVDPPDRPIFAAELARVTRPGGLVIVFEQNPLNPLTRLAVARCDFDEGVVLTGRSGVRRLLTGNGLGIVDARYVLFFPVDAGLARRLEDFLGWLPLGAQYMVAGRKPQSNATTTTS